MGKVFSVISRHAKRFNVENRAQRIISKDKPIPAPKHPGTQEEIDYLMKEHKDVFENMKLKNPSLDENLRSVYVTSTIIDKGKFGKPSDRNRLPSNRSSSSVDSPFGYEEPEIVPTGKITLKQALEVLTNRQASKDITIDKIAQTLNIKQEDAVNLVDYFSSLELHMPEVHHQLGTIDKIKRTFLKPMNATKVESIQASPSPIQIENTMKAKPD